MAENNNFYWPWVGWYGLTQVDCWEVENRIPPSLLISSNGVFEVYSALWVFTQ